VDAQDIAKLQILKGQAETFRRSLAEQIVESFSSSDPIVLRLLTIHATTRSLLAGTAFQDMIPVAYISSTWPETELDALAQQIEVTIDGVLEYEGRETGDQTAEIGALRAKVSEAELRPIAIKDDDLRDRCLDLLVRPGKADTAVRDAAVVLEDRVRRVAGLGVDSYGVGLIDAALSPKTGTLVFPGTIPEREGMHQLFRGTIGFFKNSASNRILANYDVSRARQVVGLIDTLLQLLNETQPRSDGEVSTGAT